MTGDMFASGEPFRTIAMDPPWPERGGGKIKRGADRHYDVLDRAGCRTVPQTLRVIREASVWRVADNAHLYCWTTDNYLEAGLWLVEQLGFRYVRTFVWAKTAGNELDGAELRSGIGQYARGQHELCLFAVRGRGMAPEVCTPARNIGSVIVAPHVCDGSGKRVHSAKPPEFYALVERRSYGPYLEMFARKPRPGWEVWGNEILS